MSDKLENHGDENVLKYPTTPAEYLKREMALRDLNAKSLGDLLQVHPQTIYNVTGKEKRPISRKLAIKLTRLLGRNMDFWLAEKITLEQVQADSHDSAVTNSEVATGNAGNDARLELLVDEEIEEVLGKGEAGLAITRYDKKHIQPASIDITPGLVILKGFGTAGGTDTWIKIARYHFDAEKLSDTEKEFVKSTLSSQAENIDYIVIKGKERLSNNDRVRQHVILEERQSVIVVSYQEMAISGKFLGRVGQNTDSILKGLHVMHGLQIDPGYKGPLFVRVCNVSPGPLNIDQHTILASLEFYRLSRQPKTAYRANDEVIIAAIAERVFQAISDMFEYDREDDSVTFRKATFKGQYDKTLVRSNGDDVEQQAIDWIIASLESEDSEIKERVVPKIRETLDMIDIDLRDAKALKRMFNVSSQDFGNAERHFSPNGNQTLADTVTRMKLKLNYFSRELRDHNLL